MVPPDDISSCGLGLGANMVRDIRVGLAGAFNFAVGEGLVITNPVSKTIPPRAPLSCANPLTLAEAWAFVSVRDKSWYGDAFTLNLQTGLRPGELFALIWDDFDPADKTLRIERACKWSCYLPVGLGTVKSRRSERVIELSEGHVTFLEERRERMKKHIAEMKKGGKWRGEPLVSEWLKRYRSRQSHRYLNAELMFPSRRGNIPLNPTVLRTAFKSLLRIAGLTGERLKIRWYDLRHTHATFLLMLGVPRHEVAARLGHTVMVLDNTYSHSPEGRQRRASSLFLNLIPIDISVNISRPEVQERIKEVAKKCSEDMENSLVKLLGCVT
jgi:integrase